MDDPAAPDMINPKNILVIGSNGFIGRYLCDYLKSLEYRVTEADISGGGKTIFDALMPEQVTELLGDIRPDVIFNLIGYTNEEHPDAVYRLNIFPLINIVNSVVSLGLKTRIITMGSAAEYGDVGVRNSPLKEEDLKKPISHYGVSKAAQTSLAGVFFRSKGSDIIVARPFNILGYGMPAYAVPACFVAQFLQGVTEIRTGDLSSVRDFLTVNDVVGALHCVMLKGLPGESYNISSGIGVTIDAVLAKVAGNFSGTEYNILENKGVNSGGGIPWSVGDNSKLVGLGWNPRDTIDRGISDLVRSAGSAVS